MKLIEDLICPGCGAELCNDFAYWLHIKRCQALKGKTEPDQ